jgi:hypothetical protein
MQLNNFKNGNIYDGNISSNVYCVLNYTLNLLDTTVALVELHKLTFNILKWNNKMF